MSGPRHFLDLTTLSRGDLRALLDEAARRKRARLGAPRGAPDADLPLSGRLLAMIFQKNSTRTRVSFDVAMRQLGGEALVMSAGEMQLGRGESIEDTARVLSRMVDAVMIRAHRHEDVSDFARAASIPVINGLTDRSHPCQILADLMTMEERFGRLEGLSVAWIGDGNNVCTSFVHAAPLAGFRLRVCAPPGYLGSSPAVHAARAAGGDVEEGMSPQEAVAGADVVVTDTWISMGDTDREQRLLDFAPYQVTQALMACANPGAIFLHCLPAHRGEEVTADVIDGPRSAIFDEAENRVHAQKAVLLWCLGRAGAQL